MRKILLILALCSFSASAATVYKCDANGKITYNDAPCPGGKTIAIASAPPPIDATEAKLRAEKEKKVEQKLRQQEHKREVTAEKEKRKANRKATAKGKQCKRLAQRQRWAEEDTARAPLRSSEKAKTRARRAAEKYALECGG